uniref:Ig-like domain-containing protein n=1 Tax=Catharus ustulatus TaxID=91951 RepID=A0A8C3UPR6_CATUS
QSQSVLPTVDLGVTGDLLVEPPWTPAVLWDRVTLTCQGSGTAGDTTWYKDGRRWGEKGCDSFTVTESGTYQCQRPGSGISNPVMVSNEPLVLQVPARALLEGDTVTLRCRGWQDNPVTGVRFYKDEKDLQGSFRGSELSLPLLQLQHSGRYRCGGLMDSGKAVSTPVTVTVHGEHPKSFPVSWCPPLLQCPQSLLCPPTVVLPSGVSLSVQPPRGQGALGNAWS